MSVVGENTEATVNGSELIYTGTGHADIVVRLNYRVSLRIDRAFYGRRFAVGLS